MRRTTWAAPAAFLLLALAGCGSEAMPSDTADDTGSSSPSDAESSSGSEGEDARSWRRVALRDLEVQVPAGWDADHDAARPDCIRGGGPRDPWARDVPDRPYVMVGTPNRAIRAIGCSPKRPEDDAPAFGVLPFELWQPYVALAQHDIDLDHPDPALREGRWEHRGWQLTRQTVGDVQVSVLAPPDEPELAEHVLGSARRVEITDLGCDPASPVQAEDFVTPNGDGVPPADEVAAVAVCEYSRAPENAGLEGSRRITGDEARDLVRAIHQAPEGGGPDQPRHCASDMYGDHAITRSRFGSSARTMAPRRTRPSRWARPSCTTTRASATGSWMPDATAH
ncbi:hypothetical protein [Nocardioides sp.]|uniref:hypothetical protein n=1 Tax=Nocardioides sp. TaxID=35761 RepID=UPI002735FEAB|nr:hypothetical protein [Nocardioides sp.]MDP3890089.1 hypothetical protein [Nocardioides sp.]